LWQNRKSAERGGEEKVTENGRGIMDSDKVLMAGRLLFSFCS